MTKILQELIQARELMLTLAWKGIAVRYKQAYLGMFWALLKPLMLLLIFCLLRTFVSIETGDLPYVVVTFTALTFWVFFQEAVSDGVASIVVNTHLIRKIYFPREVFPLTAVITKLVEFGISTVLLAGLLVWFGIAPGWQALWFPLLALYVVFAALTLALAGAALNVYARDIGNAMPLLLTVLMYASPTIYPLDVVRRTLLGHADWALGKVLFTLYCLNPMAGIIDAAQRVLLKDLPPDIHVILPGLIFTLLLFPISYACFKIAEQDFADVI